MKAHFLSLTLGLVGSSLVWADAPDAAAPQFSRHVTGLLSRLGCNGGTCHGAVQGQNGFRLSLFAADPARDHERLTRELGGRRLNRADPDASLLLQKATARVSHQGGKRLDVGSPEYETLRRWIAAGATLDPVESSRVVQLHVLPAEHTIKTGEAYPLKVTATFADGSAEDVTGLCSFESLDKQVAAITTGGRVEARGVGDGALIVRYRAVPALALVVVPRTATEPFPAVTPHNFIDGHILAKLRRLNIPSSEVADEVTFLRRASLDVAGELPTPDEIRAFLKDTAADKRARKIDELLARPGHAAVWTLKFCDLLKATDFGVYADAISQEADAPRFQAWVRARLEENLPYDQFAERVLTATSRDGRDLDEWSREVTALFEGYTTPRTDLAVYSQRQTLDLYWQRKAATGVTGAMQAAHAFLGLRLECAQCHRHPHDVWQQDDVLSFTNFFTRVRPAGFQGDNEKNFPEVTAFVKRFNDEAKALTEEVKKWKEGKAKELQAEANKGNLEAKKQLEEERKPMVAKEERAKRLPEIARRMQNAETQHLADAKERFATVTSPLGTQSSKAFRLPGESQPLDVAKDQDPRQLLAEWLKRPDNPYFARAIVNRVWAHYFGRGIVDPPDHLSPFNPASHPELLKELSARFVKGRYDLRWLHRTILNSRTYQQSSQPIPANAMDRSNYASFYYRRLPAEVLLDALNQATGTSENLDMKYHHWPENVRAVEMPFKPRNDFVNFMLEQFGKPARNSAAQCDCERDAGISVLQVMSLANHPRMRQKIADPKGRVARILKEIADDAARIDEVYLSTLSRLPDVTEREACLQYVRKAESPEKGLHGVMWSLINTREFLLQH